MTGTFTTATAKGQRYYQEDRFFTHSDAWGTVLAVFDGHGGAECSEWLNKNLFPILLEEAAAPYSTTLSESFIRAFSKIAEATNEMRAGSTASVVWIPNDGLKAHIAILGDSPVIAHLSDGGSSSDPSKHYHVSPEHNVRTNLKERAAAEERGGTYAGGYIWDRPYSDIGVGLQMGRAFGDSKLGKIVSKEPEIYEIPLGDWLLVCTDGATDPGHDDAETAIGEIVTLVGLKLQFITAQDIVDRAIKAKTGDNVTAILWRRG